MISSLLFQVNPLSVDNLEAAQFIYLLLHNEKIRHVIDTITSKVVLILGRFAPERKPVLDGLKKNFSNAIICPFYLTSRSQQAAI